MKFPADAATYKAWCDKLIEGSLIALRDHGTFSNRPDRRRGGCRNR
jgi:hypothetical protein